MSDPIPSAAIYDATTAGKAWLTGFVNPSDVVRVADLNTANNPPSLDASGNLNAVVLVRKDTSTNLASVVLKDGELAIVEDGTGLPTGLRAGDGATAGGTSLGFQTGSVLSSTFTVSSSTNVEGAAVPGLQIPTDTGDTITAYFNIYTRQSSSATTPLQLQWALYSGGVAIIYPEITANLTWWTNTSLNSIQTLAGKRVVNNLVTLDDMVGTSGTYCFSGMMIVPALTGGVLKLTAWTTTLPSPLSRHTIRQSNLRWWKF